MSVNTIISLFRFCLDDLSVSNGGVLNCPKINVWGLMCGLSFSNISFTNMGTLVFGN